MHYGKTLLWDTFKKKQNSKYTKRNKKDNNRNFEEEKDGKKEVEKKIHTVNEKDKQNEIIDDMVPRRANNDKLNELDTHMIHTDRINCGKEIICRIKNDWLVREETKLTSKV